MNPPNSIEQERLRILFDTASKHANAAEEQSIQASIDSAKELTQYIEKIALADAATIALLVSFIGSHSGKLQPPWLLRSSLVCLFLAMSLAMLRNWIYPRYIAAVYAEQELIALRDKERSRLNLYTKFPAISLQDGTPVDARKLAIKAKEDEPVFAQAIDKHAKRKARTFKIASWCVVAALTFTVTGMVLLIALAWINF